MDHELQKARRQGDRRRLLTLLWRRTPPSSSPTILSWHGYSHPSYPEAQLFRVTELGDGNPFPQLRLVEFLKPDWSVVTDIRWDRDYQSIAGQSQNDFRSYVAMIFSEGKKHLRDPDINVRSQARKHIRFALRIEACKQIENKQGYQFLDFMVEDLLKEPPKNRRQRRSLAQLRAPYNAWLSEIKK